MAGSHEVRGSIPLGSTKFSRFGKCRTFFISSSFDPPTSVIAPQALASMSNPKKTCPADSPSHANYTPNAKAPEVKSSPPLAPTARKVPS